MIDSEMFQEKLEGVMEGTLHIALEIQKPNTEYSIQLDGTIVKAKDIHIW